MVRDDDGDVVTEEEEEDEEVWGGGHQDVVGDDDGDAAAEEGLLETDAPASPRHRQAEDRVRHVLSRVWIPLSKEQQPCRAETPLSREPYQAKRRQ